ncbi:hypothetical protein Poli38472_008463 [Pythium oligandrum]|uniref:CBS domain-containing protein n=1 Tax=Pythium oligandrum TaxID=41045 RepID=A0A8K1FA22_PYTOL|nr:hypothetical protein Poli38472_008463 [Pythium oligandrum]|eukprot:TMW55815.1 hypothetical protein Poli38472_008463 [Pythium oligandrum]
MGAALASNRLSEPAHRDVLSEYLPYSIRTLDECAQIFLDVSPEDDEGMDGSYGRTPHRKKAPSYPRFLSPTQFDEVFGMLVADTERHFSFFQSSESKSVCAPQVFCGIALLTRTELHAKVSFLLRLYADSHRELTVERKRQVLSDFIVALQRTLRLSDRIEKDVLTFVEAFDLSDGTRVTTSREMYDVCFTNARVCGYLHEIQSVMQDFAASVEKEQHAASQLASRTLQRGSGPRTELRFLKRAQSTLQITQHPLLWKLKASDVGSFWRQESPLILSDDMNVREALLEMTIMEATSVVVTEDDAPSAQVCGFLTLQDLNRFFAACVASNEAASPSPVNPNSTTQRLQFLAAWSAFTSASLDDVLNDFENGITPAVLPFQCIAEDESLFNSILRLACGTEAVAVFRAPSERAFGENNAITTTSDDLLGHLSVYDLIQWLDENLSLLNGKQFFAVGAFPSFFALPQQYDPYKGTLVDALMRMHSTKVTGLHLVSDDAEEPPGVLTAAILRELAAALDEDRLVENGCSVPLQQLLKTIPSGVTPSVSVSPEDSIAEVVHVMAEKRVRRVFIRQPSEPVQDCLGVIRAVDLLLLLIEEQHRTPRLVG